MNLALRSYGSLIKRMRTSSPSRTNLHAHSVGSLSERLAPNSAVSVGATGIESVGTHLSGLRVYQDLRITSGLPVLRALEIP